MTGKKKLYIFLFVLFLGFLVYNFHNKRVDTLVDKLTLQIKREQGEKELLYKKYKDDIRTHIHHLLRIVPDICEKLNTEHDVSQFLNGFPEEVSDVILQSINEWCTKWNRSIISANELASIKEELSRVRIESSEQQGEIKKCEDLLKKAEEMSQLSIQDLTKKLETASNEELPRLRNEINKLQQKNQEKQNIIDLTRAKYEQLKKEYISADKDKLTYLENELEQAGKILVSETNKYKREIQDIQTENDKILQKATLQLDEKSKQIVELEHSLYVLKGTKEKSDKLQRIIALNEDKLNRLKEDADRLLSFFDTFSTSLDCETEHTFSNPTLYKIYNKLKSYLCEKAGKNKLSDDELLTTLSELVDVEDIAIFHEKCSSYTHPVLKLVCEKGKYVQSRISDIYRTYQSELEKIEKRNNLKRTSLRREIQELIINKSGEKDRLEELASLLSAELPEVSSILTEELHKRDTILSKLRNTSTKVVGLYHTLYDWVFQKENVDKLCSTESIQGVVQLYKDIEGETTGNVQSMLEELCKLKMNQIVTQSSSTEDCKSEYMFLKELQAFSVDKLNSFLSIDAKVGPTNRKKYDSIKTIMLLTESLGNLNALSCGQIKNIVRQIIVQYPDDIVTLQSFVSNMLEDYKGYVRVYVRIKPFEKEGLSSVCKVTPHTIRIDCDTDVNNRCKNGVFYSNFSNIFTQDESTSDIYVKMRSLFEQLQSGYSILLFGYGLSGTGKSYTLLGSDGLVKHVVYSYSGVPIVSRKIISAFELYSNTVPDLTIIDQKKKGLQSKRITHISSTIFSSGVTIPTFSSFKSELDKIEGKRLQASRIKPTKNNIESSRSHLFITIELGFSNGNKGYITFVDLAGRERPDDLYRSSFVHSSSKAKIGLDDALRTTHSGLSGLVIQPSLKKLYLSNQNDQQIRGLIMDSIREGFFINETMNHLVYYLNKKIGKSMDVPRVKSYSTYDSSQFFNSPEEKDSVGILTAIKEIENLASEGKNKCVMMCTIRQEIEYCEDTILTLNFASSVKST